jgi:hypothetical protein
MVVGPDRVLAYLAEWTRWCKLGHGNLQHMEGMQTHDAECSVTVNMHMGKC